MSVTPFYVVGAVTGGDSTSSLSMNIDDARQKDDLLILLVATANQAPTTPSGWTKVGTSAGVGTAGTAGAVALYVYYKVSDGTETTVAVSDSGDHQFAGVLVYRGVDTSSPIHTFAESLDAVATTSFSCPSVTTSVANAMILNIVATDYDSAAARLSGWTNAALTNLTEKFDAGNLSGTGSGIGYAEGVKTTTGAVGNTTGTIKTSTVKAFMTLALKPSTSPKIYPETNAITITGGASRLLGPTDSKTFDTFSLFRETLFNPTQGISTLDSLCFNADGSSLYILRNSILYQYTLSTAWNVSTATYTGKSFSSTPNAVSFCWNDDGTKLFYISNYNIYWSLASTPYDLSTVSTTVVSSSPTLALSSQVQWKLDGTAFFISTPSGITKYTVSTPWTFVGQTPVSSLNTGYDNRGFVITPDGKRINVTDQGNKSIRQFNLGTAWNLSTAVNTGYKYNFGDITSYGWGLQWSSDGSKIYLSGNSSVHQLNINMPVLTADTGSFAITGQAATLIRERKLPADTGSFGITGIATTLKKGTVMPTNTGSFAITGNPATLSFVRAGYTLEADTATFGISGQPANLRVDRNLSVDTGAFTLTGQPVNLRKIYTMVADTGSFVITGSDVKEGARLITQTGVFTMSFANAGSTIRLPALSYSASFLVPSFVGEVAGPRMEPPTLSFHPTFLVPRLDKGVKIYAPTLGYSITFGGSFFKGQIIQTCSGETVPSEHMKSSRDLIADAYVDLFEITLAGTNTKIYMKANHTVEWQGHSYEGTGIKIDGVGSYADDQVSRPKLTIWNPEGVFSSLTDRGILDNAKVYRIRVLKLHIDEDVPIYRRQQWRVSRISSLNRRAIILELRDMLDGQNFLTPGRMFIPPDFPAVKLT